MKSYTYKFFGFVLSVFFSMFSFYSLAQNVIIGPGIAQAPLHINNSIFSGFESLRLQGSQQYISFYSSGTYQGYLWSTGSTIDLGTASGTFYPVTISPNLNTTTYFTSNGRVGIGGVSIPAEKLDAAGNIKFSGSLKPGGNSGVTGQVLQSTGSTPTWITLPGMYDNTYHDASFYAQPLLGPSLPEADVNGLNRTVILSGNAKVMISYSTYTNAYNDCCGSAYYEYYINIDGTNVKRNFQTCSNDKIKSSSQTFIASLSAGTHVIKIRCHYYQGPRIIQVSGEYFGSVMDIVVMPQ